MNDRASNGVDGTPTPQATSPLPVDTEMLLAADQPERTTEETVTETFIYIIRRPPTPLGSRSRESGHGAACPRDSQRAGGHFVDRRTIPPVHARIAAETIVRLIISILTTPATATDFDNDEELRSFAYRVIPPLVASE